MGNHKKEQPDMPYAFEAKEALRKLLIGKRVNIHIDYSRKIKESD